MHLPAVPQWHLRQRVECWLVGFHKPDWPLAITCGLTNVPCETCKQPSGAVWNPDIGVTTTSQADGW